MNQTPQQRWEHQNWRMRNEVEAKQIEKKNVLGRLLDPKVYSIYDYDIRPRDDHFESYNKITDEALFEASTHEEAMADLRDAFCIVPKEPIIFEQLTLFAS